MEPDPTFIETSRARNRARPVMRETQRFIIRENKIIIQCPRVNSVSQYEGTETVWFCGGVAVLQLGEQISISGADGKCGKCGFPASISVDSQGVRAFVVVQ